MNEHVIASTDIFVYIVGIFASMTMGIMIAYTGGAFSYQEGNFITKFIDLIVNRRGGKWILFMSIVFGWVWFTILLLLEVFIICKIIYDDVQKPLR